MTSIRHMRRAAICSAALLACAPGLASAQDSYFFAFGGAVLNGDQGASGLISPAPATPPGQNSSVDTDYDTGFQFGLGVGRSFGSLADGVGLRGEIELSYADADADTIAFSGNGPANEINVAGGIQSTTLFANILADFETGGAVTPYVGAGVGIGRFSQDLFYGGGVQVTDSDTAFGAQLIAGVAFEATETVTITADARYRRFFDIESNRFLPSGASSGVVSGDFSAFSINVGARIAF
ncbi:outer membrane beta-barrel protein [uncultured Tateyamaria sp.]|uniref:outer membrane protein n=1 Tax=uncultured Tateyamaria sp. TaxID=455651 RepID=UPI00263482A8|nr:outer membrane beta-barrel protein [uncultured Tateyamaria sp.]